MNLLIAHGRLTDIYLVQAAQAAGHKVHFMCNLQEEDRLEEVRMKCNPDVWLPVETQYDMKASRELYQMIFHATLLDYVRTNNIHAILPSSSMDMVMKEVSQVNELFDLPGIRPEQAEFFRDKTVYLPALAKAGVRVPEIYEIVEPGDEPKNYDFPYPAIAKPGLGCGGYGIYIAESRGRMEWFFGPSEREGDFSKRALFYQDRDSTGKPKSYLHFGFGGRYFIQQYLEGPCISLTGTTIDGVPKLDLAHDIGVSPPPTCAEISFGWPSVHEGVEGAARRLLSDLSENCTFPDGAWMADAIFHEGELWLVDLSPRMSSSGTKMLYHTSGHMGYPGTVVSAAIGEGQVYKTVPKHPVFYSFFPFLKGKIDRIRYPDRDVPHAIPGHTELIEVHTPLIDGDRIYEMRNDIQVADRGWVVTKSTGGTRKNAQDLAEAYIGGIQFNVNIETKQ